MADVQVTQSPGLEETLPADYARNAWAFALDSGMFQVAMVFVGSMTVFPAFIATLTNSEVVVGLASGLFTGGWLLPQLLVASAVVGIPRKKPIVVRAAWASRPVMLLIAIIVWLFGLQAPTATLIFVLTGILVFAVCDAIVTVPWFDLLAKCLPARRRGRVLGASQIVGGLGGIGGGMIVRFVLGDSSPWEFPANYALLFAIGGVCFLASAMAMCFIREPEAQSVGGAAPTTREVLASLPRILVQDRAFLRMIIVKLLNGFVSVASVFYVLHATTSLGLGLAATGLFASLQVAGSLTSGLLMGVVQDRWGPLVHIRLAIALSSLPPAVALCAGPLSGILGWDVLYLYLLLFFSLGLSLGGIGWPFFNWVLEHAQETQRPLYIGMSNTLTALVMLAPALGGWVVSTISYAAAFSLALVFSVMALALSLGLPSTRQRLRTKGT